MIKVSIIGSGNVAQHLIKAFTKSESINLVQVYSRNKENLNHLIHSHAVTNNFNQLIPVDLFIIAVSDDSIASVSAQLPFENCLVVHTSGSQSLNILSDNNRKGVFYPLQTFTKNKDIDFNTIPICIESQNKLDTLILEKVAGSISNNINNINSQQRKALHIAAVFVSNFTNCLYQIGADICVENNMDFEILKPLIKETAEKVMIFSPKDAQTGPAKRNDLKTINDHINFLTKENQKVIYKILTQSIIDNGKKL